MKTLFNTGRPCIVGEFGMSAQGSGPSAGWTSNTRGSGTEECNVGEVVTYASQLGFPVLAWAWNGDGGSYNMMSPSWVENAVALAYEETAYFWAVIGYL